MQNIWIQFKRWMFGCLALHVRNMMCEDFEDLSLKRRSAERSRYKNRNKRLIFTCYWTLNEIIPVFLISWKKKFCDLNEPSQLSYWWRISITLFHPWYHAKLLRRPLTMSVPVTTQIKWPSWVLGNYKLQNIGYTSNSRTCLGNIDI